MKFSWAPALALLAGVATLVSAADNTTVASNSTIPSNTTVPSNTTSVGNTTSTGNITSAGNATSAGGVAAMDGGNSTATPIYNMTGNGNSSAIAPKVVIVTLFELERDVWVNSLQFTQNISLPGASPLFPYVTCDQNADVCLITTGEGEINAAATFTSFLFSSQFDLRKTYFIVNGIAGVNPHAGTVGSVSMTRFAIQVGLQYGLDGREVPQGWNYSFWNYGTETPGQYPGFFYGTEIFEVNTNLRDKVYDLMQNVTLSDNDVAKANRANFTYAPANQPPTVFKGDVTTSDLYFTGTLLCVLRN